MHNEANGRVIGQTALVSRNIRLGERRTSIKLEPAFWDALHRVARKEGLSIHDVCGMVAARTNGYSLTGAVRVFLLSYYSTGAMDAALATVPVGGLPDRPSGRVEES